MTVEILGVKSSLPPKDGNRPALSYSIKPLSRAGFGCGYRFGPTHGPTHETADLISRRALAWVCGINSGANRG